MSSRGKERHQYIFVTKTSHFSIIFCFSPGFFSVNSTTGKVIAFGGLSEWHHVSIMVRKLSRCFTRNKIEAFISYERSSIHLIVSLQKVKAASYRVVNKRRNQLFFFLDI